jgi:signal transduction histidine kinase
VLIVVRPPWSLLLFGVVAAVAAPLAVAFGHPDRATYYGLALLFNASAMALLIWLTAKVRELRAARLALAAQAVVRERLRVAGELGRTLGSALESIAEHAGRTRTLVWRDPSAAGVALVGLAEESRQALAQARRLVRRYRTVPLRAEVDAAAALLSAAGIPTEARLSGELPHVAPDDLRAQLRAGIARLLADQTARHCLITVRGRDGNAELDIRGGDARVAARKETAVRLGSQYPAEPLPLLLPGAERSGHLVGGATDPTGGAGAVGAGPSRWSRWCLVAAHLPTIVWPVTDAAVGILDPRYPNPVPPIVVGLVILALQLRHSLAAARGQRARGGIWTLLALAVLVYAPMFWFGYFQWHTMPVVLVASALMVLRGRAGFATAAAVTIASGVMETVAALSLPLTAGQVAYGSIGAAPFVAFFGAFLYGSARMVRVLDELHATRAELAQLATARERLRISRDLHDLLGQSLTAISLKADLAARLLHTDAGQARGEVEDLTTVAHDALHGVRAVALDEYRVSLRTEIQGGGGAARRGRRRSPDRRPPRRAGTARRQDPRLGGPGGIGQRATAQ